MLKRVTLKNFQSHKNLEVDCAGFTTLTGGSNGGKSAVLRAILGLVRNDSAGDYVRHGQKSLSVKLEFDDGQSVEWIKGGGQNKYILTDDSGERVFDKVGTDAPEEIRDVLKLGPVAVKGSDKEYANFHSQLESPFLISATPGTVAKLFGELTSASQLYTAVNEGNRQARSTGSLKSTRKKDLDKATQELSDGFYDLDDQLEHLEAASNAWGLAEAANDAAEALAGIMERLTGLDDAVMKLTDTVEVLAPVQAVDLQTPAAIDKEITAITGLISGIKDADKKRAALVSAKDLLDRASKVEVDTLEAMQASTTRLSSTVSDLTDAEEKINELERLIAERTSVVDDLDAQIQSAASSLDSCPSCGQELSDAAKESLVNGGAAHATC